MGKRENSNLSIFYFQLFFVFVLLSELSTGRAERRWESPPSEAIDAPPWIHAGAPSGAPCLYNLPPVLFFPVLFFFSPIVSPVNNGANLCANLCKNETRLYPPHCCHNSARPKPDYLLLSHTSPPVQPPLGFLLTLLPSFSPFVDSQGVIF